MKCYGWDSVNVVAGLEVIYRTLNDAYYDNILQGRFIGLGKI